MQRVLAPDVRCLATRNTPTELTGRETELVLDVNLWNCFFLTAWNRVQRNLGNLLLEYFGILLRNLSLHCFCFLVGDKGLGLVDTSLVQAHVVDHVADKPVHVEVKWRESNLNRFRLISRGLGCVVFRLFILLCETFLERLG